MGSPRDRAEARGGEPRAGHDPVGCTSLGNAPGRAMTTRSPRLLPIPQHPCPGAGVFGGRGPWGRGPWGHGPWGRGPWGRPPPCPGAPRLPFRDVWGTPGSGGEARSGQQKGMKGARRFTCRVREAFSCSGARRAHPEEVQIKGDSSPDICIIAGFRSAAGRAFGCRARAPHRGLPLASPGARHGGGGTPGGSPGGAGGEGVPAPTRRHLRRVPSPGRLAGGSRPRGSPRRRRAGIKGLKGTAGSHSRPGRHLADPRAPRPSPAAPGHFPR